MRSQPMPPPHSAVPGVLPEPARVESDADNDATRAEVRRAARRDRSGGWLVERATLLAGGAEFGAAVAWIEAHGGVPELPAAPAAAARPAQPTRRRGSSAAALPAA